VQSRRVQTLLETYRLAAREGARGGTQRRQQDLLRAVHVIKRHYLHEFAEGEVLVTDKTDPDWERS